MKITMNWPTLTTYNDDKGRRWYAASDADYEQGRRYISVTEVLSYICEKWERSWLKKNSENKIEKRLTVTAAEGSGIHNALANGKAETASEELAVTDWKNITEKHSVIE